MRIRIYQQKWKVKNKAEYRSINKAERNKQRKQRILQNFVALGLRHWDGGGRVRVFSVPPNEYQSGLFIDEPQLER